MKRLIMFLAAALIIFTSCKNTPSSPIVVIKETDEAGNKWEYEKDTVKGVKHGYYKCFTADGKIIAEKSYKNDTLVGVEKFYYENGKLMSENNFKDGEFDGPTKTYFKDGTLQSEGTYVKGALEGELKSYHKNGKLKEIVIMVNNVPNGPFEEYHKNGKITAKGTYLNEKEHCYLELYDEDGSGELLEKKYCRDGSCCKFWTAEDGDVKPSNSLCEEIIEEMKGKCDAPAEK